MVRVEIEGAEQAFIFIRDLPIKLDKALSTSNEQFMKDVRRTSKFKCPRSSGKAARGLRIKKTKQKGKRKQWKLVATKPHTYWIINGRGPGRGPPVQELMKWNKLDPSKVGQTNKFAAALKLSKWIAKHGTKPNDFIGRAIEHNIVKWETNLDKNLDKAIK